MTKGERLASEKARAIGCCADDDCKGWTRYVGDGKHCPVCDGKPSSVDNPAPESKFRRSTLTEGQGSVPEEMT